LPEAKEPAGEEDPMDTNDNMEDGEGRGETENENEDDILKKADSLLQSPTSHKAPKTIVDSSEKKAYRFRYQSCQQYEIKYNPRRTISNRCF
jgi:hypothetical protein